MDQKHCWDTKCKKSYNECLRAKGIDPVQNALELRALAARVQVFRDLGDVYGNTWRVWPGKE
jgi:hypothetical protein